MEQFDNSAPVNQLEWLAFIAQQRGWHELAEQIAADADAAKQRENDLQARWFDLRSLPPEDDGTV
jgi:hypothetical protein